MACATPAAPSTAGTPSARSITAVCPSAPPSSVATPASRDGSSKRRIGRAQRLADQDGALRQAGEAAERRAGQVAHQAAGDFADFVGAALQAGAVLGRHAGFRLGQDRLGDRVGLRRPPRFRPTAGFPRCAGARRGSAGTGRACGYRRRSAGRSRPGFPPAGSPAGRAVWPAACATGRWRLPAGRPRRRCRRPGSCGG